MRIALFLQFQRVFHFCRFNHMFVGYDDARPRSKCVVERFDTMPGIPAFFVSRFTSADANK